MHKILIILRKCDYYMDPEPEDIFKQLDLETEEDRDKFNFLFSGKEEEINVSGLGLSTCS